jgi:hypothetical protein
MNKFFIILYFTEIVIIYVKTRDLFRIGNNLRSVACHESKLKKYLQVKKKQGEDNKPDTVYEHLKWLIYYYLMMIYLYQVYIIYIMFYIQDLTGIRDRDSIYYNCRRLNFFKSGSIKNWGFSKGVNSYENGVFVVLLFNLLWKK